MATDPESIGRYQVRERLGSGGFATVYLAYDPLLDIERAIKLLHPHLARDAAMRERFIREGRILARIRHPNLVQVFDAGEADGHTYLAMELVRGGSLRQRLADDGPRPVAGVLAVVEAVAALDTVHAAGLLHRDVKPENILMEGESGRPVLLDLGIARDEAQPALGSWVLGTPTFMAAEQVVHGGQIGPRTDVYQLAATVYQLLADRPPFATEPPA